MKRCSMCAEYKSYNEFSKSAIIKDGYQGYCKECAKQYRDAKGLNKGVGRGRPRQVTRVCTRCNLEKNVTEFKGYYFCKACTQPRGSQRKYTEEEIQKRRKESSKRSYEKNHHNWTKKKPTREQRAKYARNYRSGENGHAVEKSIKHRRRSRKKASGSFTAKEWRALLIQYNNTCLCCKRTDVKLTPDHIKPLALGGSNTIDNIQPLCLECNVNKGATEVDYRI